MARLTVNPLPAASAPAVALGPARVAACMAGVFLGAIGLAACGGSAGTARAGPAAGAPGASAGCEPAPAVAAHPYPGSRAGDCVGYAAFHFIVRVDGYEALVGNWKRYTDDQGRRFICAGVNLEDLAASSQPVAASQFRLRTPAGSVETAQPAPSNGLPSRPLANGVQQGGGVCWPDPGLGGLYVGSFEPASGPARGIWTISFLPG